MTARRGRSAPATPPTPRQAPPAAAPPSPLAAAALRLLRADAERPAPPGARTRPLSAVFADIDQSHEALRLALAEEGLTA